MGLGWASEEQAMGRLLLTWVSVASRRVSMLRAWVQHCREIAMLCTSELPHGSANSTNMT